MSPALIRSQSFIHIPAKSEKPASETASGGSVPSPQPSEKSAARPSDGTPMRRRLSQESKTNGASEIVRKRTEVTICGSTSLVGIKSGSLFDGKPLDQKLLHGEKITIDIDHPIFSRRGPNQEVVGNRNEDSRRDKDFTWYPKYSDNGHSDYENDEWPHLRADTFLTMTATGDPAIPLTRSLPPHLRGRAVPNEACPKMEAGKVKEFIQAQKDYQDNMAKHGMASIMLSHRSIGLEFEFTGHDLGKDYPSHVVLAQSANISNLFPLKFVLETDSGAVLEIGMPPFLVANTSDGGVDKCQVQTIFTEMKTAMEQVRDQLRDGASMKDLLGCLASKGLGTEWTLEPLTDENGKARTDKDHEFVYLDIEVAYPKDGKLYTDKGAAVYSQLNISLNGDESSQIISEMKTRFDGENRNGAEKGKLGELYRKLESAADTHLGENARHAVHVSKAFTSILAIPSLMLQAKGKLTTSDIPDEFELSSQVKELYSMWVKDSLPNILRNSTSTMELPGMSEFLISAREIVLQNADEIVDELTALEGRKPFKELISDKAKHKECKKLLNRASDISNLPDAKDAVDNLLKTIPALPSRTAVVNTIDNLRKMMKAESEDFREAEGGNDSDEALKKYTALSKQLVDQIESMIEESDGKNILKEIKAVIAGEIDQMIELIESGKTVSVESTTFGEEAFGDGKGVRKDTFIAPIDNAKMSIGELRSDGAINVYLKP